MAPEDRMPWWSTPKFAKASGSITHKKAVSLAEANWSVEKAPLYASLWEEDQALGGQKRDLIGPSDDFYGLVRKDTKSLLYVVGGRYMPIQNITTARWGENIADESGGQLVGAWVMKDDRVFGVSIEPGFNDLKVGGEVLHPYLHVLNWHGDGALEVHVTFETQDQLVLTGAGNVLYARDVGDPSKVDKWADEQTLLFENTVLDLAKRTESKRTLLSVYDRIWAKPREGAGVKAITRWNNRRDEVLAVWERYDDDSAWAVYLAFTEWAQFVRHFRGSGGDPAEQERLRGEEVIFGHAREIGEAAFKQLVKVKGKR